MLSWQLSRINKLQYKMTKSKQSYFMYLFIKHSKITLFCILETVHCEYCWLLYYTIWVLFLTCDSTDKQKLYLLNEQIWCKWLINWTTSIQGKGRPCQSGWAVWKCTSYCMLNTHLTWFWLQDFPAKYLICSEAWHTSTSCKFSQISGKCSKWESIAYCSIYQLLKKKTSDCKVTLRPKRWKGWSRPVCIKKMPLIVLRRWKGRDYKRGEQQREETQRLFNRGHWWSGQCKCQNNETMSELVPVCHPHCRDGF